MPQVNVTINGRQFRMACEDGQEEHLSRLARELDGRIETLRAKFGEIGDTRLTVMAALTIADELGEMELRLRRLEEELMVVQEAQVASTDRQQAAQAAAAASLNAAAERIESVTKKLNAAIGGNSVALG
ncbi:MAG: cell division protein ZapA [Xanthobacteraceae bacterium]